MEGWKGSAGDRRKSFPHSSNTPFLQSVCSYQVDLLALCERHDGLLPMRPASERTAHAFLFAGIIARVYIDNFLLKQALYRLLDLNFVCPRTDAENVFILFFTHQRRLLRQGRGLNDVVGLVHFVKSRCSLGGDGRPFRQLLEGFVRHQDFLEREQLLRVQVRRSRELHRSQVTR